MKKLMIINILIMATVSMSGCGKQKANNGAVDKDQLAMRNDFISSMDKSFIATKKTWEDPVVMDCFAFNSRDLKNSLDVICTLGEHIMISREGKQIQYCVSYTQANGSTKRECVDNGLEPKGETK